MTFKLKPINNFVWLIEAQLQIMSIALQTEMLETNKHGWDNQIMVDNDILIKAY
jgi:hypothetical protein